MKTLFKTVVLAAALLFFSSNRPVAAAPKYAELDVPATIQAIVAYSPGGGADALARVTLPYWKQYLERLTGKESEEVGTVEDDANDRDDAAFV